jgi:4-carboxymuconolactone decarboxylase
MARLPEIKRENLSGEQLRVFDQIEETRGNVRGPFAIWLNTPHLAEHCLHLQHFLNYGAKLKKRFMQLMILIVARRSSAQFAWFIHARHAAQLGISPEIIEAIRTAREPHFVEEDDKLIYELVTELCSSQTLSEASHGRAMARLSKEELVELVTGVGFYGMVSLTLNAFDAPVPGGARPLH